VTRIKIVWKIFFIQLGLDNISKYKKITLPETGYKENFKYYYPFHNVFRKVAKTAGSSYKSCVFAGIIGAVLC